MGLQTVGPLEGPVKTGVPVSGLTPTVGLLVKRTSNANNEYSQATATAGFDGIIRWVNGDGTLFTVEELRGGAILELPYENKPTLGHYAVADATGKKINGSNTVGIGQIIAVDHRTGYALVEAKSRIVA